jgi:hypothetical protein
MLKFNTIALIVLMFLGVFKTSEAQVIMVDKVSATQYLDYQDYNRALDLYLKLYEKDKEDIEVNYNIGMCYMYVNRDKSHAIRYLEFVKSKGKFPDDLYLYLGKAYMYAYKFDQAIEYLNMYRATVSAKNYPKVDLLISNCENSKVLIKKPVNVTFENLGPIINTKYADYYPFLIKDEGTLYFTSRRSDNTGKLENWQAYYTSDIYFSKVKNGEWQKAKNLGVGINTPQDEQCVYITPDGKTMIIYKDDEQKDITGDLFMSMMTKNKSFAKPIPFDGPVNTESVEFEGCINMDANMLIVASDREGTMGETDLFMLKKLPNGNWGMPLNLGENINTPYKEAFPVYNEKEHLLYFASEGHTNMGGYDIFKSEYNVETQTFGPAINIGYPINTPEDNMEFTLAENKRDGYVSAVRKEGYGDLDIYKVTFNDVDKPISVLRGVVSVTDTTVKEMDAFVTLLDAKTKEEVDAKNVNPQTGRYIFAIEPGKYILQVTSSGYVDYTQNITVYDKSDYIFEIEKNILLQTPAEAATSSTAKPTPAGTKPGKK